MKKSVILAAALLVGSTFPFASYAQDDEARQQSGLPTFIGSRPGSNPGATASLSGKVVIEGPDASDSLSITVYVQSFSGATPRQRIANRGAYSFSNVSSNGPTLVVEVENHEVARYPLPYLNQPPLTNRQDVILNSAQVASLVMKRKELAAIYARSERNQQAFDKAMEAVRANKNDEAIKLFKQVVGEDANDLVAWTELGNVYFTAEKYADAENSYAKALALKPAFFPAVINNGKVLLVQKKFDASIEMLSKAVELDPASASAHRYLGEAYLQAKKGSKAVGHLNKAIELEPIAMAELHFRLAALYHAANVKDRAAAEYKLFLAKVPNYPQKSAVEKYIAENAAK